MARNRWDYDLEVRQEAGRSLAQKLNDRAREREERTRNLNYVAWVVARHYGFAFSDVATRETTPGR